MVFGQSIEIAFHFCGNFSLLSTKIHKQVMRCSLTWVLWSLGAMCHPHSSALLREPVGDGRKKRGLRLLSLVQRCQLTEVSPHLHSVRLNFLIMQSPVKVETYFEKCNRWEMTLIISLFQTGEGGGRDRKSDASYLLFPSVRICLEAGAAAGEQSSPLIAGLSAHCGQVTTLISGRLIWQVDARTYVFKQLTKGAWMPHMASDKQMLWVSPHWNHLIKGWS